MSKILIMLFLLAPFMALTQADTVQRVTEGRANSKEQQQKPYVILISADGFRHDLATKFNARNLLQLREEGVTARAMIPAYPSLTFPNHYTLVTGLYPSHHGLVDNTFIDLSKKDSYSMSKRGIVEDGSWYGGTPLWVLAEQQQMLTASFYWVGSEAAIKGIRPTYYYRYNEDLDIDRRIAIVKNWLTLPEEKRPHLITFYFPEVDHEAHSYGPDSKQAEAAVQFVDENVRKMVHMTNSLGLPVNYIFVSDHGMTVVDTLHTLQLPAAADTSRFFISGGDVLIHLYAKNKMHIRSTYKALKKQAVDYKVYLPQQTPKHWHYTKKDDWLNRIGDILLVPEYPKVFNLWNKRVSPGKHGYDNAMADMQAAFYAWGPAFKPHTTINAFENVHVYPLIATILGLTVSEKIDGSGAVLSPVLLSPALR